MKKALVALDHTSCKGWNFEHFCRVVQLFQKRGLFPEISLVSVTHASLYAMPTQFYRATKGRFAHEALGRITSSSEGRFNFEGARVLQSDSPAKEDHVAQLSRYGRRLGVDALVMASSDRRGLPYWFLGSFSETASLTATLPVLIIKPQISESDFSRSVRFVVAVDAAVPPSALSIRFLAKTAKSASANVDLVYVDPARGTFLESLKQRKTEPEAFRVLARIQAALKEQGVSSTTTILKESRSVAHTVVDFAEEKKAWMTVTTAAPRSRARKLLLGSTGRHILSLTKRPFLAVRME
ncbi:MAG: universal stress protein [Candidatus Binatia bacterium]